MSRARPSALPVLLALLALVSIGFALPLWVPGDPAVAFLGQDALTELDAVQRQRLLAEMGLEQPLWRQYATYLWQLARLDWGHSFRHGEDVAALLAQHLPWTLLLVFTALGTALAAGTLLGMEAAFAQGRSTDRVLTAAMLALESVPVFALGMGLALLLAYGLPWFPAAGAAAPFSTATGSAAWLEHARHLALPAATLALPAAARVFLITRAAAVSALLQPYMEMARAKGVSRLALRWRHLAPNVLAVTLARLGSMGARLVAGSIYVETVFAWPGVNLLLMDAIGHHDYPLVRSALLTIGLLTLALNLTADAAVAHLTRRTERLP